MQKGIVFELENGMATVMKNNGDFVSVLARPDWKKGDVVTVKAKAAAPWKTFATIAACFLLFISISAIGAGVYFNEAALISLDVNPSIELSVNRFDRVIGARSLNDEGSDILQRVSVKNRSLDNAVSALFDGGLGDFIPENPLVTFTVFSSDTQSEQQLLSKLQSTTDTYVASHHGGVQVEVLSVDENLVKEAHEYNVTAGKYVALRQLQQVLPEMEMENYSHHSISYIREQTRMHGNGHDTLNDTEQRQGTPGGNQHRGRNGHKGSKHE